MSAHRVVVLLCDVEGCGSDASLGEWFTTTRQARHRAEMHGWRYVRAAHGSTGRDLCPYHREELDV